MAGRTQFGQMLENGNSSFFDKSEIVVLEFNVCNTKLIYAFIDLVDDPFRRKRTPALTFFRYRTKFASKRASPGGYDRQRMPAAISPGRPRHIFLHRPEVITRLRDQIDGV